MTWITRQIKAVMLIAGVLTSTMIYAAVAPQAALLSTFGEGLDGPVAEIVVRNRGALIGLVGNRFLSHQAGVAVVVDTLFVILFALYLAAPTSRQGPPAA